jgi:hypothetical protein
MVLSGEVTDEPAPLRPPGVEADDPGHQPVAVHGEATDSAVSILPVKKNFHLLLLRWTPPKLSMCPDAPGISILPGDPV